MIAGLSKAVTLYLAPILALTATILALFAYLAPSLLLHDQVALLTVTPSTALLQTGSSQSVDGPSVFLGVLGTSLNFPASSWLDKIHPGSCSRSKNSAPVNCTAPTLSPQYGKLKIEILLSLIKNLV